MFVCLLRSTTAQCADWVYQAGQNFMDITDWRHLGSQRVQSQAHVSFPKKCTHQPEVTKLAKRLDKSQMEGRLQHLSSYHTRYYETETGLQASDWILSNLTEMVQQAGANSTVSVESFPHSWKQHSVIATIPGRTNSTIVIGAHLDSANMFMPSFMRAPGADDDGSGTVTIMEVFRALLRSSRVAKGKAQNTIEFHWYSAEEAGLLGSQAIFQSYAKKGRDVKAMLQQDMTGYVKGTLDAGQKESVGVIDDFVDPGLTQFIKTVIDEVGTHPHFASRLFEPPADLLTVLRYPVGRDQVRLRMLRPRLSLQGRISISIRH